MASSARRWRSSSLKSGSPALTVWLAHTATSLTTSANGVPMAMFSVLVSTKPTAATVCENGETGGAEGGVVGSRFGCERTTETMPKVNAAKAIRGRMIFFMSLPFRFHRVETAKFMRALRPGQTPEPLHDGAIGMDRVPGQHLHPGLARRVLQRRRRLIAKNQSRFMHEPARQRHALL